MASYFRCIIVTVVCMLYMERVRIPLPRFNRRDKNIQSGKLPTPTKLPVFQMFPVSNARHFTCVHLFMFNIYIRPQRTQYHSLRGSMYGCVCVRGIRSYRGNTSCKVGLVVVVPIHGGRGGVRACVCAFVFVCMCVCCCLACCLTVKYQEYLDF